MNSQAAETKADATGTWSWEQARRGGGEPRKSTLTLKVEGEKLVGKLSAPGRGGAPMVTDITEGTMKGDEISFKITRQRGENTFTTTYTAKLSGDTLTGKMTRPGRGGGEPRVTDWVAKREKMVPAAPAN